jgi:hypothetical protein
MINLNQDLCRTWLYIKRHNQTSLLYFGKTDRDPTKYKGSGTYWRKHLSIHGNDVTTICYELFTSKYLLENFARWFSEEFDIVKKTNDLGKKIWANEVPETGLQGQVIGWKNPLKGMKTGRISIWRGKKRPEHSKIMKGRTFTESHKLHMSESRQKYTMTPEHGAAISKAKLGKPLTIKRIYSQKTCSYCGKIGKGPNMIRYHFENCKFQEKQS